jgi:hypothetical protein
MGEEDRMVAHPFLHMEIACQRHRELLVEAGRRRLADRLARPRGVPEEDRRLAQAGQRRLAKRRAFTLREERT